MITKYCIVVSNLDNTYFFLVGPFDNKRHAQRFTEKISHFNMITSIHPYIKAANWIGRMRGEHLTNRDIELEEHEEELLQQMRETL